jgi:3-phosphoglycerate kinase
MFHTLDEADVRGKRVLVRVDLNVPVENGKVADTTRIERVAPTIREIADKGGKVILLSHFGRPNGPDPHNRSSYSRRRSQPCSSGRSRSWRIASANGRWRR